MYRLRNIHDDYHTAFMLSIINLALTILGGLLGGAMEALVELISSLVSFGQTYYIIRATNGFLNEAGRGDVVEKGRGTIRMYAANLCVALSVGVIALVSGELGVVLSVISLAIAIGAMVMYIQYLGAAKECF